jgi:nitroreductase
MELLHAIHHRRAVRQFTDVPVHPAMIHDLLKAAVQAPSALNQQPWAFAVIRGRERLDRYSGRAKAHLLAILPQLLDLHQRADALASREYNVFHHAENVVVIYAQPAAHHPVDDCLLAAQNLMLAAHGMGLGTCPIGFARPWFDLPEIKRELGIPENFTAAMPLAIGWPAAVPPAPPRHEPNIVCWIDDTRAP